MGSDEYYTESYSLLFSKDGKNWKLYKGAFSKEKKVWHYRASDTPGLQLSFDCWLRGLLCESVTWLLWFPGISGLHRWSPQGSQQLVSSCGCSVCSAPAVELARQSFSSGPAPGLSRCKGHTEVPLTRR